MNTIKCDMFVLEDRRFVFKKVKSILEYWSLKGKDCHSLILGISSLQDGFPTEYIKNLLLEEEGIEIEENFHFNM